MGMFDELLYKDEVYQTKDTPQQTLDTYEIRSGGELWWRKTEYEWVEDKDALFGAYMKEISHEWVFCKDFDGKVRFYREDKENGGHKHNAWIEYEALFMDGKIIKFKKIDD